MSYMPIQYFWVFHNQQTIFRWAAESFVFLTFETTALLKSDLLLDLTTSQIRLLLRSVWPLELSPLLEPSVIIANLNLRYSFRKYLHDLSNSLKVNKLVLPRLNSFLNPTLRLTVSILFSQKVDRHYIKPNGIAPFTTSAIFKMAASTLISFFVSLLTTASGSTCDLKMSTQCYNSDIKDAGVVVDVGSCCEACMRTKGCRL